MASTSFSSPVFSIPGATSWPSFSPPGSTSTSLSFSFLAVIADSDNLSLCSPRSTSVSLPCFPAGSPVTFVPSTAGGCSRDSPDFPPAMPIASGLLGLWMPKILLDASACEYRGVSKGLVDVRFWKVSLLDFSFEAASSLSFTVPSPEVDFTAPNWGRSVSLKGKGPRGDGNKELAADVEEPPKMLGVPAAAVVVITPVPVSTSLPMVELEERDRISPRAKLGSRDVFVVPVLRAGWLLLPLLGPKVFMEGVLLLLPGNPNWKPTPLPMLKLPGVSLGREAKSVSMPKPEAVEEAVEVAGAVAPAVSEEVLFCEAIFCSEEN